MGEGSIKNGHKYSDVFYGRPLMRISSVRSSLLRFFKTFQTYLADGVFRAIYFIDAIFMLGLYDFRAIHFITAILWPKICKKSHPSQRLKKRIFKSARLPGSLKRLIGTGPHHPRPKRLCATMRRLLKSTLRWMAPSRIICS